jgi:RNA polymerase sigma-70 factor (ECF subfamily)
MEVSMGIRAPVGRPSPSATIDVSEAYRGHGDFVFRVLERAGVPEAALDDALQDVFLVLHRRRGDFREERSVRAWLYGIARRVAFRHRFGLLRLRTAVQRAEPPPEPSTPPSEWVALRDAAAFVERFLRRLTSAQREVFVLAEIEELSVPEIAVMTGSNPNTVYSRLRLARERFMGAVARERRRDHNRENTRHDRVG